MKNIFMSAVILSAISILILLPQEIFSQSYTPFSWQPDRAMTVLSDSEKQIQTYILEFDTRYEYVYDEDQSDPSLYITFHQTVKVNNDEGINQFNRIYIPLHGTEKIEEIKARTIQPNGKITVLDENNIKEIKDEESGSGYKIFAIEGAVKGCEIEYYYIKKADPVYFGKIFLQNSYPIKNSTFRLICPENLHFIFKGYNGNCPVEETDDKDSTNIYDLKLLNIPGLRHEEYSYFDASRRRLEFKLNTNDKNNLGRLFTFAGAARRMYDNIYDPDKNETRAAEKIIKSLRFTDATPVEEKIRTIENYIKTGITIQDNPDPGYKNIADILSDKIANNRSITRLYAILFDLTQVRHQIVFTISREEAHFDPAFPTWDFLNDFLIYFPDQDKYLSPYSIEFRYGIVPMNLTATWGLFIYGMPVQDFTVGVGEIKWIPALNADRSCDNINLSMKFNDSITHATIDLERSFSGYLSAYYKISFSMLDKKKADDLKEEAVKFIAADAAFKTIDSTEQNFDYHTWNDPWIIKSKFTTSGLIQNGGNTILVKIGELIGPQSELYQDNKRVNDVENDFNRGYHRRIKMTLPEGYKIINPDDLNKEVYVMQDSQRVYSFKSTYTLEGKDLSVAIDEFYNEIYFPLSRFEDFRKVINAAADWNKITLVLKKE